MNSPRESWDDEPDRALQVLLEERSHLTNLAYRLLGSLAEAEDVVQEAYARWYAMTREQQAAIKSPGAWLTTVASRICLDVLGSARVKREQYTGEWVPEPVPGGTAWINGRFGSAASDLHDPADRVSLDESITMAFLVVLESMTAAERVAFVLHDVFLYPFDEVAAIVGRTPGACRQLATSARRRLRESGASVPVARPRSDVIRSFKEAWETKNIGALLTLLDPQAMAVADSGGKSSVVSHVINGAEDVAASLLTVLDRTPQLEIREQTVNGQPGLVALLDGVIVSVLAFDVTDRLIGRIWVVRNPEKLRAWT